MVNGYCDTTDPKQLISGKLLYPLATTLNSAPVAAATKKH